jgi:hypothetical protein
MIDSEERERERERESDDWQIGDRGEFDNLANWPIKLKEREREREREREERVEGDDGRQPTEHAHCKWISESKTKGQ